MIKLDDFEVSIVGEKLEITADPHVLRDLCITLDGLLVLTRYLQRKSQYAYALKHADDAAKQMKREVAFNKKSLDVFCVYQRHLDNGCGGDKKLALQETRRELNLMACDAKLFVAQGRRLERERRRVAA